MIETVGFIPSEQREQVRQFDIVINSTKRAISALVLAQTLPKDVLDKFSHKVDGLFLPNVSHSVLSVPTEYASTNDMPLLVTHPNDHNEYQLDGSFVTQTFEQEQGMLNSYREHGWGLSRFLANRAAIAVWGDTNSLSSLSSFSNDNPAYVSCRSVRLRHEDANDWSVMGRPIMRMEDQSPEDVGVASKVFHELVHEEQFVRAPVQFNSAPDVLQDAALRRELEAYHKQFQFDVALENTGDESYADIHSVTNSPVVAGLIHLNAFDDPYAPSEAVKQTIRDRGLRVTPPEA